jgi:DNA-binding GntR family transcriptional regulator
MAMEDVVAPRFAGPVNRATGEARSTAIMPGGLRRRFAGPPHRGNAQDASAATYNRLRHLIVGGLLAPGSPLIESDLTARLHVSRTPVRAALQRLEQEGFVRGATPGSRRAIVSPLTAADLREVFLMVGALEATAARQAAALDAARREAIAAAMEDLNARMRAGVAQRPPDLVGAQDLHLRVHRAFVDAVAGPRLRAELDVLSPQAERYQRVYGVATLYAVDDLVAAHAALAWAIRAGDGDGAEQAAGADWRLTAERHCEIVAMLGERGNW